MPRRGGGRQEAELHPAFKGEFARGPQDQLRPRAHSELVKTGPIKISRSEDLHAPPHYGREHHQGCRDQNIINGSEFHGALRFLPLPAGYLIRSRATSGRPRLSIRSSFAPSLASSRNRLHRRRSRRPRTMRCHRQQRPCCEECRLKTPRRPSGMQWLQPTIAAEPERRARHCRFARSIGHSPGQRFFRHGGARQRWPRRTDHRHCCHNEPRSAPDCIAGPGPGLPAFACTNRTTRRDARHRKSRDHAGDDDTNNDGAFWLLHARRRQKSTPRP